MYPLKNVCHRVCHRICHRLIASVINGLYTLVTEVTDIYINTRMCNFAFSRKYTEQVWQEYIYAPRLADLKVRHLLSLCHRDPYGEGWSHG